MATAAFVIKIKTPDGHKTISDLNSSSTIGDLKGTITNVTGIKLERLKIYFGFPPKPLVQNDNAKMCDANIRSGDVLIVQSEENKETPVPVKTPIVNDDEVVFVDPRLRPGPPEPFDRRVFNRADALSNNNGIMMRHDVPSNNSCLFTSIYFLLHKGEINLSKARDLRRIAAEVIQSDPVKFNAAYLSRDNADYCAWILNPNNWGGAIELAVFSDYFKLEICAIDIVSCTLHRFGQSNNFPNRCFVVYDGIHYDPLVMQLESDQQTIFPIGDSRPLEMAMEIAREAQSSRQFTDMANFKLMCTVCQLKLKGEIEATAHAKDTGHQHFGEFNG